MFTTAVAAVVAATAAGVAVAAAAAFADAIATAAVARAAEWLFLLTSQKKMIWSVKQCHPAISKSLRKCMGRPRINNLLN